MSEGGINFGKTKKKGRVVYNVRQRVNECASKNTRSHAAGNETDFATNAPVNHADLSATATWNS
jgi:hypothetical protein